MIGKLVRHIKFDAIGIVVGTHPWSETEEGYKVKFLKPVPRAGTDTAPIGGFMIDIIGKATSFEELHGQGGDQ